MTPSSIGTLHIVIGPFLTATAAALALAGATTLPPPSVTVPGRMTALAAAGPRAALATGCAVRVANLVRRSRPVVLRPVGDCRANPGDSWVADLRLGSTALAETTINAPSPHGEQYGLWTGALPAGPLHLVGEWGWTDSDVPQAQGCAWSVAAGGGAIALAKNPNTLGDDPVPACPAGPTQQIRLIGAARSTLTVPGSWSVLATDGKRVALSRLDVLGQPTGEVSLWSVNGKQLTTPRFDAATVKAAYDGWLTPQGLILETTKGISAAGWTIKGAKGGTVGEGRLLYLARRTVRVRRLRDRVDRPLVVLPSSNALLAAGSYGLAVAIGAETRTKLYRLPWRTIDRTLRP